jgi:hypothetical protein
VPPRPATTAPPAQGVGRAPRNSGNSLFKITKINGSLSVFVGGADAVNI